MNQIYIRLLFCIIYVSGSVSLSGQVTIGSDKVAVSGALLQLKQFETDNVQSDGLSNANKGLGMPCVSLQALNGDLATSLGLTPGSLDKDTHVGLTVYNASDICASIAAGTYVWNGTLWQYLGGSLKRTNQASFDQITGILTDYEGNQYRTKVFGSKRWMTQNLRAIRKADGACIDPIDGLRFNPGKNSTIMPVAQIRVLGSVPSGNVTYTENGVLKMMTNEDFITVFGLFYTWNQAMVACPAGWHLPSAQDWNDLVATLGATDIGAKLRGNTGASYKANDSGSAYTWGMSDPVVPISGFDILPAGWVREDGVYAVAFSGYSYLWSSASTGGYRYLNYSNTSFSYFSSGNLNFRFSVRCVQN